MNLVRDEDEPPASRCHLAKHHEQLFDLARRKDGGRLVEDKQRDIAVESFDDLHPLALAN